MKPRDIFLFILFVLGLIAFLVFICCYLSSFLAYSNDLRYGITTEYYFLNNIEEFEIISTNVSYTKFGSPCYNIFTVHIPTGLAYHYQTSLHNYLVLGGNLNGYTEY